MVKRKSILIVLLLLSFFAAATGATTRKPVVAGGFYPAEPAALRQLVAQHLDNVKDSPVIEGKIVALIVPHAGLVYSGQIAAHSYKLLEGSGFDKVILCGPSHRYPFRGISVYGPEVTWQTPLGNITCADQLCRSLISFDP
ncbi:MAG: AmmeMemoRadiSam system protein B, partial [candidate division Zixibacteria bacterium]|nr:AmmeMemoRadiSam system protein B [candidate division Zixibacteria bacterium]